MLLCRLTVEVEAVMAPAVMPTGDESAAHNEPHDESAAVAVTCNPLYLASLDAASSLPQGALRQLTQQLPTQDENGSGKLQPCSCCMTKASAMTQ